MIKFNCSSCGKKIGVPEEYAGKRVRCPGCKQPTAVPVPEPVAVEDDPYSVDLSMFEEPTQTEAPPTQEPDFDALSHLDSPAPSANLSEPSAAASPKSKACPNCGALCAAKAALCVTCGYSFTGGKKQKTKTQSARAQDRREAAAIGGRGILAAFVGLIVALVGGGLWAIIMLFGVEIGILAWGIGIAVGFAVGAIARTESPIMGGVSSTIAAGGILFGKLLITLIILLGVVGLELLTGGPQSLSTTQYAAMHAMIQDGSIDPELKPYAESQLGMDLMFEYVRTDDFYNDHFDDGVQWAQLNEAVAAKAASMSNAELAQATLSLRESYDDVGFALEEFAAMHQMVQDDAYPEPIKLYAQAELNMHLSFDEQPTDKFYYDHSNDTAEWDQVITLANDTWRGMTEPEVQAATQSLFQAYPDAQGMFEFEVELDEELQELDDTFNEELGDDRSFVGIFKSTLSFFDILWFFLAISTAYGITVKQG